MNMDLILGRLLVICLGIPIHEWAHGWVAHLLGDDTPEREGRLSLNPLTHLDPIGTLMILMSGFGWGRPARVNPYRMRRVGNPRVGMALSALAGPLSNIFQAALLVLPLRFGLIDPNSDVGTVLRIAVSVNIGLAAFNLLPIPPLDGSRILAGVASPRVAEFLESLEPVAPIILVAVLFVLPQVGIDLVGWLVGPLQEFLIRLLFW